MSLPLSLTKLLSRRAALVAAVALATGTAETDATPCTTKCKKEDDRDKKDTCLKKCKKTESHLPRNATVSGVGQQVSSTFPLATGRYLISATHAETNSYGGNFIVHLWGPKGYEGYIFNELPFDPGTYQYQTVEEVPYNGSYFFEAQEASGPWTISVRPI